MLRLDVNGHAMSYTEHGSGTPLLLIHGSLLDQRYWAPQIEFLGERHRVVAPSLRRYWPERWDGAGGNFTIAQHMEDVAAFIDKLGAGPVHLLGHSRGGHIAFRVAQHRFDLVRTLVLVEPGGSLDATLRPPQGGPAAAGPVASPAAAATPEAAERIRRGDVDGGLEIFVDAVNGPGAWEGMSGRLKAMHRDNASTLLGQIDERRPPFARADAEAIRAPTLLVGGERTGPPFPTILDALENSIGDAVRATIADAGHMMSDQEPEAFGRAVLRFLDDRG